MSEFSHLLSPLKVGARTLRNRVLITGHTIGLEDGGATDGFIDYHRTRARGGAGLQITGFSRFHRTGYPNAGRGIDMTRADITPSLARLAEAVHGEGGTMLVQLGHASATVDYGEVGQPLLAPSAIPSELVKIMPRAVSTAEIAEIVKAYGAGARHAVAAGLDGIEILAAFGYLPGAFFSPRTNQRTDAYGGSLENRVRFALEAAAAAREAAGPDAIVGMRIPGDEMMEGGLDGEAMAEIAALLSGHGALDYLNVAAGSNADRVGRWEHWAASPAPHGLFVPLAARIRRAVSIPVFVTGRITDPAHADAIVAAGDADMIGMTRAHIADPRIVAKISAGRAEEIRPCVGANVCINRVMAGKALRCFHNVGAGREAAAEREAQPSAAPVRIAVFGGGPAGMEAARSAAARGHKVSLYEASQRLGGQLRLWAASPFAREFDKSVAWYERELERHQVRVHLGRELDTAALEEIEADVAIVATGSRPAGRVPFAGEGESGLAVVAPAEILAGRDVAGVRHAVVLDEGGGRNGLAAAELLAEKGVRVTLVSGDAAIAETIDGTVRTQLYRFLLNHGVVLRPMEVVAGLAPGRVLTRNVYSGAAGEIGAVDLVVDWRGNAPVDGLVAAARARFAEVAVVGDALAPRTVEMATAEGAAAINALG